MIIYYFTTTDAKKIPQSLSRPDRIRKDKCGKDKFGKSEA